MSLTENSSGLVMPVSPMYGNNGGFGNAFGGDGWWILLLLLFAGGGWGNGFGGFGGNELYPWLNNSQNVNDGFRDSMLNNNVTSNHFSHSLLTEDTWQQVSSVFLRKFQKRYCNPPKVVYNQTIPDRENTEQTEALQPC